MKYDSEAVALAHLRNPANLSRDEREAFNVLDNARVFASVDSRSGYAGWEEILEAAARDRHPAGQALDPAEWGDTTRADMARHQSAPMPSESAADRLLDAGDREAMGRLGRKAFGLPDTEDGRF